MSIKIALFLLAGSSSLLHASASRAVVHTYTEDFTTTVYCDSLRTTALWDAQSGTLGLPPFEPATAGSLATLDRAYAVEIDGHHAYVADYTSGLVVVDISDPAGPVLLGSYDTQGRAYGVAVSGDYAYVADYTSGLVVVDISDPANPSFAGSCDTPGKAFAVALAGDFAYVADERSGITVVNISDPTNPVLAGGYNTSGQTYGASAAGDHLFVADGPSGLLVLDISIPSNPAAAGALDTPGEALWVTTWGDLAYVADGDSGLRIIDISDPLNPFEAGSYPTPGRARGVVVSGTHAYVADGTSGLTVIDASTPADPRYAGGCDTPGDARLLSVAADYACLADNASGVRMLKIANLLMSPVRTGSHWTQDTAYGVAVSGKYAYVGAYASGLNIFDVSDAADPTLAGIQDTPDHANNVKIYGDYAYVADWASGLQVIDISDPANPALAGSCDVMGSAIAIDVAGDYAYVGSGTAHVLNTVDIADPANPVLVATTDTPGITRYVVVAGDYAYVADLDSGLLVIDVADPLDPVRVAKCDPPGYERGLAVWGNYAYLGADIEGLQVVDISDPLHPVHVGACDTPGLSRRVTVAGNYAFVADHASGLQILDVSDPVDPSVLTSAETVNHAHGVAVAGDFAFVADWEGGLQQIQVFERARDVYHNQAQSTVICEATDLITLVRLSCVNSGCVGWYVSADSGLHWQAVSADSLWHPLEFPGRRLLWKSEHLHTGPGSDPTCSCLKIECWEEVTSHTLDGTLDPNCDLIASGNLHLYADFDGEYLYVASEGVAMTAGWDHFILIGEDLEHPLSAPWAKAGTVAGRSFYLAAEDTNGWCGWFDETESELTGETVACACGAYLEGMVRLDSLMGAPLPDTIYLAVGAYESPDGGILTGQAPAGDADGDIEGSEYVVFSPGTSGIDITDPREDLTAGASIIKVWPSPSRTGAEIMFSMTRCGALSLGVFDTSGREVAVLSRSHRGPGLHSVRWNGEDNGGARVSPGIYFIRLKAGNSVCTEKMVLIR